MDNGEAVKLKLKNDCLIYIGAQTRYEPFAILPYEHNENVFDSRSPYMINREIMMPQTCLGEGITNEATIYRCKNRLQQHGLRLIFDDAYLSVFVILRYRQ